MSSMSIYLSSLQFSLNLNIQSCYSRLGKPKIYSMMSIGGIVPGLFISKGVIEAQGGRICAENNTDEKGTTLYALPIVRFDRMCLNATGLYQLITQWLYY
jgi:hypothetical protein